MIGKSVHGFLVPMALVLLAAGAAGPAVRAAEFSEAELYVELNNTDGDLGIHASIDGGPYSELRIEDSQERVILRIAAQGRLVRQGLTQLFFESAEPRFTELTPAQFFARFPEGAYEIEATRGRTELEATVELSHVMAAPPSNITISGHPAAESCDAVPLPSVQEPVIIVWDPVEESHPTIGKSGPVEIVRYQFFVQQEDVKFAVDLPPSVTSFQVPSEILAPGGTFKFEIIARTADLNNTAVESCFTLR